MHFHAGQEYCYAVKEHYKNALDCFAKAYKNEQGWDTYIDGTVAFIANDHLTLKLAAEKLANLAVGDRRLLANAKLLKRFNGALDEGLSYAEVYNAN